jgi:hypothetical protein
MVAGLGYCLEPIHGFWHSLFWIHAEDRTTDCHLCSAFPCSALAVPEQDHLRYSNRRRRPTPSHPPESPWFPLPWGSITSTALAATQPPFLATKQPFYSQVGWQAIRECTDTKAGGDKSQLYLINTVLHLQCTGPLKTTYVSTQDPLILHVDSHAKVGNVFE